MSGSKKRTLDMSYDCDKIEEDEGSKVKMRTNTYSNLLPLDIQSKIIDMILELFSKQGQKTVNYIYGEGVVSVRNGATYVNGKKVVHDGSAGVFYVDRDANVIRLDDSQNTHGGICPNDECRPTDQKRAKTETKPAPTETKSDDGADLPVILDGEECTICYEPYRRAEDMKFLPCAHFFHRRCVENWQVIDNTCPLCRLNAVTGERA